MRRRKIDWVVKKLFAEQEFSEVGGGTAGTVGGKKIAVFHLSQDGKNHQKPAH
jgi:hypothetical protein